MECTSRSWAQQAQIPSRQSVIIIPISMSLYVYLVSRLSHIVIQNVESLVVLF